MKKLLAVLAIVAISGSFAKAEDKGTEFKFGGQLRERFYWDNNPTLLNSNATTESNFVQRNQFHVNAISGDRIQAYFNLLHTAVWGGTGAVPQNQSPYAPVGLGVPNSGGVLANNTIQLHEAWLWWKASDNLSLRAGRQSASYGDGFIISRNDWLNNPYNFEGVMGRLSWDFLDLDFGGAKLADAGLANPSTPAVATAANTDTEVNVYAVNAALKNLPEVLKAAELTVAYLQGDTNTGGISSTGIGFAPGFNGGAAAFGAYNLTTVALHVKGDVTLVDYRFEGAYQTGKQKSTGAGDVTFTGSMIDVEAGLNFPEFMKARVSAAYHVDSGNDTLTTDTTQNHQYQPMFYDLHEYAGYMNFFGFGNLTDIRIKLALTPEEMSSYGVMVNIASRTTANAPATILNPSGGNMFNPGTAVGTDKSLGTEFDLFANHNYGHGLSSYIQVGVLSVGNYFKPTGVNVGTGIQGIGQVAYNF